MLEKLKNDDYFLLFLLFMITVFVYYNSLFGGFIFDDVIVVLKEPLLKKEKFFDFLRELPFKERPLRLLSFYLDKKIWGFNPFGYRFTNLVIHISNGILIFFLLKKLNFDRLTSFFSSGIFLWHFVNPATICYITGRKDLLGFFFTIIAFFAITSGKGKKKLFLLFYFLAFLTKEMFITIPIILLIYLYFVEGKRIEVKFIIFSTFVLLVFTYFIIEFREVRLGSLSKRFLVPEYFFSYLRLFFDPTFPKVDYVGYFNEPYTFKEINWGRFVLYFSLTVLYFFVAFYLLRLDKILGFLLLAFFISLLPVLQIIQHSESFAEHYFYFPSLFLSVYFSKTMLNLNKKYGLIVLIFILIFLLPFTHKRTHIFTSEDNFWVTSYEKNPKSFRAKRYYALKNLKEGNIRQAKMLFEEGFIETSKLFNYSDLAFTYYFDFLNDLALCSILEGDLKKAEHYYLRGIETIPDSNKRGLFLYNLSILYLNNNQEVAKKFMKDIILKNPQYKEVSYLLYDVYWQEGQMKELESLIDQILIKDPRSFFALSKKILLNFKKGNREVALKFYEELKKLSPSNYYELNDAAEIEIYLGRYDKAQKYLLMALEEKPEYGRTRKNLMKLEELKKNK